MIHAVLFDFDGVLLDSFDAWLALMNAAAVHFGHPPISAEAFRKANGQSTQVDVDSFYPDQTVESIEAFYREHFSEYAGAAKVDPQAHSVIQALDDRELLSAVITNTHSLIARPLLKAAGLLPHALVAADDVAKPKPAPDMIFRACEVLGAEPWDALVVGDSRFDRQAAASAGSPFAGIHGITGNFTISELREVLDIVDGRG